MKFTPVVLNRAAPTANTRKGALSIITIGLQGGTRFISNWLVGIIAGRAVFEAVSSATSMALMLNTLWPSSTPAAASKFISRARGKGDDAELFAVTRHASKRVLQASAVLSVAAPVLWVMLYRSPVWEGLCISLILLTVGCSQFARGVHFGAGQVARGTKVDVLTSLIGIVGTGLLLLLGVRSVALTLPLSLAMGTYALLCWPWTAHGRPAKALRSEVDKFVTFGAMGSIASAGMLQVSQLTAKGLSDHAAQINAPAMQLVTPLSIIASALTLVLYPAMAEAQGAGDLDRLRRQTHLATQAFMAFMVPCFGFVAIASRPIISLVYFRGGYEESATLMPVYALALLVYTVAAPSVSSITSGPHKHMWFSLSFSQLGFVCAIVSWVLLTAPMGVFGVALGYGIGSTVTATGLIIVAWVLGRQRWAGLMTVLPLAMVAIGLLAWWRQQQPVNHLLDVAVGLGFVVLWCLLWSPVLLRVWRNRRRR